MAKEDEKEASRDAEGQQTEASVGPEGEAAAATAAPDGAAQAPEDNDFGRVDPDVDSNSSGDSVDPLNDEEARLAADPALEPEAAWERDESFAAEAEAQAAEQDVQVHKAVGSQERVSGKDTGRSGGKSKK